ncbi:MAG TPA: PAS domain S-box protein, partial [Cyclobacteriaceae bacterium]|nr:PAS domain S-box protein [Cyclobacteriaceae bacterium]
MVKKTNIVLEKKTGELTASRFKALLENAYDGIVLYDSTGAIQYASPSIKAFFGYTNHDVLGRRGTDFIFHEDVEDAREIFYKVLMQPGKSVTQVQRFITKKGDVRWFEYTLTNLLHNPEVNGIVSNFRDIHEKKTAEEKANKSQQLLTTISENIVDGIFFGIPGEEFQYVNKAFLEITGYASMEELQKVKPQDLYAEAERWQEIDALLKKHQNVKIQQVLFRRKNGDFFWGAISITLFEDKTGQRFFAGSIQDITRQKQAEEQLLKSQQLLNSISRNVNEGIYRSSDKKLRYVNEAFIAMFGYQDAEEIINLNPAELFADSKIRKQLLKKLKKEKQLINEQVQYRKKNGELFWGLMSGTLVKSKRGETFIDGAVRDITKQKEAEDKLQQSEQMLAT